MAKKQKSKPNGFQLFMKHIKKVDPKVANKCKTMASLVVHCDPLWRVFEIFLTIYSLQNLSDEEKAKFTLEAKNLNDKSKSVSLAEFSKTLPPSTKQNFNNSMPRMPPLSIFVL